MSLREALTEEEQARVAAWLDRVLHDLVKYMEMMLRSLDWSALEDEDLDIIYEAIFETRSERGGVLTAREVFERTLDELPTRLRARLPLIDDIRQRLAALEVEGAALSERGVAGLDSEALRGRLFGVGDALRASRGELRS